MHHEKTRQDTLTLRKFGYFFLATLIEKFKITTNFMSIFTTIYCNDKKWKIHVKLIKN